MLHDPICAVTVCIGYADFFRESVRLNHAHFDKWVVVTSPRDHKTQQLCRQHRVICVVTDDVDGTGAGAFRKGLGVERGLRMLPADSYICHIDADVVLPSAFRQNLEIADLKGDCLYGVDRFMVKSYADWQRVVRSGWPHNHYQHHPHCITPPHGFEIGARWVGHDGWVPIGFFQLWHRANGGEEKYGARLKRYPQGHSDACREDVQFALYWDRAKRVLIPDLFVAHLESEACHVGSNWKGRKTKWFGPAWDDKGGNCAS